MGVGFWEEVWAGGSWQEWRLGWEGGVGEEIGVAGRCVSAFAFAYIYIYI